MAHNPKAERLLEQFIAAGRRKPDPEDASSRAEEASAVLVDCDKPWFIGFKNRMAAIFVELFLPYFIRGRQREILFKKTLGRSNHAREQKGQADADRYRAMAAEIAQNHPDLSNNALAERIWKKLPLPEKERPAVRTIRKALSRK